MPRSANKTYPLLMSSKGLHINVDPVRLPYDHEKGFAHLVEAVNVWIDDTGRIKRRKGYTKQVDMPAHSMFCEDGQNCLFVSNGKLYQLNPDFTAVLIRENIGNSRMSYCQVADRIFYANGAINGVFMGGTSQPWEAEYVGPETSRVLTPPPVGSILSYLKGRIYIAQGNFAYYTETYDPYHMDALRNFIPLPGNISMLHALEDVLWIGTNSSIYALMVGEDMQLRQKAYFGAISGTDLSVPAHQVFDTQEVEQVCMFMSKYGVCVGDNSGSLKCFTSDRVDLPDAIRGSAFFDKGQYITTIQG